MRKHTITEDLRSSDFLEMLGRASWSLQKSTGLLKKKFPPRLMSDEELFRSFGMTFSNKNEFCQYFRDRKTNFFFEPGYRQKYKKILNREFCEGQAELLNEARRNAKGKFYLLGKKFDFASGNGINWHVSERQDSSWPFVHWLDLDFSKLQTYGDVKIPWELNRHQHFLLLGRAWWFSGDKIFLDAFKQQISSWMFQNPPEIGINWQSNLEIALRTISWVWGLPFFIEFLDDDILLKAIKFLVHHGIHLNNHLWYSEYCMRNNHLVGDATGLFFVAFFLPELKFADRWRKRAFKILSDQMCKQIYPDGTSAEQSTHYLSFVYYMYLNVYLLAKKCNIIVPCFWKKRLQKVLDFFYWICDVNCEYPKVGDSDDGKVTPLAADGTKILAKDMLSTGALVFDRGDYKEAAKSLSEETFWMLGTEVFPRWKSLGKKERKEGSKKFSYGGFLAKRWETNLGEAQLLFRAGPSSKHHAHADQLSLTLSLDGSQVLVESGTYCYNTRMDFREYFRTTPAHNTILIDGKSQMTPYRSFRWLNVGSATPIQEEKIGEITLCYASYINKYGNDRVEHVRAVGFTQKDEMLLLDLLFSHREHEYEVLFHFPYEACLTTKEKSGKSVYYANCDATKDIGVSILSLDKYDQVEEVIGEKKETGYQGWLSPSYGVLRAAPVLVFKKRGRNSVSSSLLLTFLGQEDIDTKKIESAETIKNDCLRFLIERFGG